MRRSPLLLVFLAGCVFDLPEPGTGATPVTDPDADAAVVDGTPPAGDDAGPDAGTDGFAPPATGIGVVQKTGGGFAKVETVTHPFTKPVTAGNAIIVFAYTQGTRDVTLSDSEGNSYQPLHVGSFGLTGSARFFFTSDAKSSATPASITMAIVDPTNIGFVALEYSGLLRGAKVDDLVEDYGYVSTTSMEAQTDPMKTQAKQSLVLAAFWYSRAEGVITPGAGWESVASDPGYFFLLESRIVPPGSVTATATMPMTYEWGSVFATFAGR